MLEENSQKQGNQEGTKSIRPKRKSDETTKNLLGFFRVLIEIDKEVRNKNDPNIT